MGNSEKYIAAGHIVRVAIKDEFKSHDYYMKNGKLYDNNDWYGLLGFIFGVKKRVNIFPLPQEYYIGDGIVYVKPQVIIELSNGSCENIYFDNLRLAHKFFDGIFMATKNLIKLETETK